MDTVTIVGVGLIGGSFGLALRKAGFRGRLIGVSSPGAIRDALERGAIDEALPLAEGVARADLVYLAQPIRRILETLAALDPWLRPGSLVTDAGSTKARIVEQGRQNIRRGQFLGGHPMAGKEKRGAAEADPGLFAGRTYVLTPSAPEELETPAAREFLGWLRAIGAVTIALEPQEHDRVVARTSHLPQLLSTALAMTLVGQLESADHLQVAGPGLADTLRLAASSYEIWGDILATNTAQIDAALAAFIAQIEELRAGLGSERTEDAFRAANDFAARLKQPRGR
ncbi:MAG: prephenate dehydrogenase/arogenate dehydrogenase family protein [Bryobacteraceae bacterium]|jgi:prephenate dehydrogenase